MDTVINILRKVLVGVTILAVAAAVALVAAIGVVWWGFLVQSITVAAVWAMVATALLIPFWLFGGWIGYKLGAHQSDWIARGIETTSRQLAQLYGAFGVEAADVRVYTSDRLGMRRGESRGSQEIIVTEQLPAGNGHGEVQV